MRTLKNLLNLTIPAAVVLLVAAPLHAVQIFTLDAPVTITGSNDGGTGVRGVLNPVFDDTGSVLTSPAADGLVNFANHDVFMVELQLFGNSATVDEIGFTVGVPGIGNLFANPKGAGAMNDIGAGRIAPDGITADNSVNFQALFDYGTTILNPGQTTVRLFATYSPAGGTGNILQIGDTVSFMISSGTDFTVQGTIVPEPATALLFGTGLLGLLAAVRRSSR